MPSLDLTRTEKKCSHCHETKPIDQFRIKIAKTGVRQSRCIPCQKIASRAHYVANAQNVKSMAKVRKSEQTAELRELVLAQLAGKCCKVCGAEHDLTFVRNSDYPGPRVSAAVAGGMAIETVLESIKNSEINCTPCMQLAGTESLRAWQFLKKAGVVVPPNPVTSAEYKARHTKSSSDRRRSKYRVPGDCRFI